ncbi:MAG TPA: hypothetical protein VFN56_05090 [Candidatus Saccharimonadales bacterium]|nr:hypothetical protein [Candidatus Saccharimonadales bacterium]
MALENHEEYTHPASPDDIGHLAVSLAVTVHTNVDACAMRIPNDSRKPLDVILAGTIDAGYEQTEVVVAQRAAIPMVSFTEPDDMDMRYVVQYRSSSERMACLISKDYAQFIKQGMPRMSIGSVLFLLDEFRPGIIRWCPVVSALEARAGDPYRDVAAH